MLNNEINAKNIPDKISFPFRYSTPTPKRMVNI